MDYFRTDQGEDTLGFPPSSRRSGLYILGKPGMGKSTLMVNLINDDLAIHYATFFLDPHGEAIRDVIATSDKFGNWAERGFGVLLDPTDEQYSFGLDPLYCSDIESLSQRMKAYTRTYSVFQKLWENDWGVWLQLILENTIPVFIENQKYTLAEVPLFLTDKAFREHLLANVKHHPLDFWEREFQPKQAESALTRIRSLLSTTYVRDIIGQYNRFPMSEFVEQGTALFLHLPASLSLDIRRFIGTLFVNELQYAIRERENTQHNCYVYVDEFQHFATNEFAELILEGRKYGCAITIAHQERVGQFENQRILGATSACANKVLFQTTTADAKELAPEFAPFVEATDIRREAVLVPSTRAAEDIWDNGSDNKVIADFRKQYLWVVDHLRRYPKQEYLHFVPEPMVFARLSMHEFNDWEMFRTSAEKAKEAIGVLNDYWYDWMKGKYSDPPVSDDEFRILLKIVFCLGGVYGFRPAMYAYIPETMRHLWLSRIKETDYKMVRDEMEKWRYQPNSGRETDEQYMGRLQRTTKYGKWELSDIPSIIYLPELERYQQFAERVGLSEREIEESFRWSDLAPSPAENLAIIQVVSFVANLDDVYNPDGKNILEQYMAVMYDKLMRAKVGLDWKDRLHEEQAFQQIAWDRCLWQVRNLVKFVENLRMIGKNLKYSPIKISSGIYEEKARLEQTHADRIVETAQEITNLPRFSVKLKMLYTDSKGEEQVLKTEIKTLPLGQRCDEQTFQKRKAKAIENGRVRSKSRAEIQKAMEHRQTAWRPIRPVVQQAKSKPPPTSV